MVQSDSLLDNRKQVTDLIKAYGDDTLSYFHLQDHRQYFFSPSGNSFLSFKIFNTIIVVAADPVGPENEITILLQSFLAYAKTWKLTPCFVGLSKKYLSIIEKLDLKIKCIGEEAIVDLLSFESVMLKKKVKRAIRHIEKLAIEVFFFTPQNIPEDIYQQIHKISAQWVSSKGGKEKGFSMTLKRIPDKFDNDCQFVVAIQKEVVLGYLCFVPVYQSQMLSLDQIRKRVDSPNGLNEFLIIKAAEYFKGKNVRKLSLNFATLSHFSKSKTTSFRHVIANIIMHLYRSYSLKAFNEKFSPEWHNRYIAYPSMKHLPLYLLAILRAER